MHETAKLTASDGKAGDDFGCSVSISGNTVVVGAENAKVGSNVNQGAAYVFTETGPAWGSMTETAKLTVSTGKAGDQFGWSVSISGNTVVVGAPYVAFGSNDSQGAAYVFTENGSSWTNTPQTATLTANDGKAGDFLGFSVSTNGNTVVVGAAGPSSNKGEAYVFGPAPVVTSISPTSGPAAGGTTVTIAGTAFTGATGVKFGATAAGSFTVNSATQITATSPAGTGVVDVTVTTPGGTSPNSSADQFTYAACTVTGVTPASGLAVGGTTVTIAGTGFTGATAVKFRGTAATTFTVNSATEITATSPPGTGVVDVTVVTPGSTSPVNRPGDQFTYLVPTSVTGVSPASGPAAGGTSVTITGTGFTGATAVWFGLVPVAYFTVNSATQITTTSPGGTGAVDVLVIAPGGTSLVNRPGDQFTYVAGQTFASPPRPPARTRRVARSPSNGRPEGSLPAARSPCATTPTPRGTATRPGSSMAWPPLTATANTVGTPPAWRRARTTSAAISCRAARRTILT